MDNTLQPDIEKAIGDAVAAALAAVANAPEKSNTEIRREIREQRKRHRSEIPPREDKPKAKTPLPPVAHQKMVVGPKLGPAQGGVANADEEGNTGGDGVEFYVWKDGELGKMLISTKSGFIVIPP